MPKGLKKALIQVVEVGSWKFVKKIPVLFYPSEYTQVKSANYPEEPLLMGGCKTQHASDNLETLEMNLFFDTYESNEDVRIYTKEITDLLECKKANDGTITQVLNFVWGPINFTCVLESVTKKFTMFRNDGVPVRATLTVKFKEYVKDNVPKEMHSLQGMTQVKSIKAGDSLWSIAAATYGSASMWRSIAEKNNIANPRLLVPGKEIILPPRK
jgi:hypothetical protein